MTTTDISSKSGYVQNLGPVVQHVADALDKAFPDAVSVSDIADHYRHVPESDFTRIRHHQHLQTDREACEWLIEEAITRLRGQRRPFKIQQIDADYRLADGVRFADLRWHGKPITRPNLTDENRRLGDRFNQKRQGADWADDIRGMLARSKDDSSELLDSMQHNGWVDDPIFDALVDEHGVVLVGHRRLRIAAQLDMDPANCGRDECQACGPNGRGGHIRTVPCGRGDVGDIKRLMLAVVSNIGHHDISKGDRQKIVKVLAGPDHDWTQMSIAKALGVSQSVIRDDLATLRENGDLVEGTKSRQGGPGKPRKPRTTHTDGADTNPALIDDMKQREAQIRAGETSYASVEAIAKKHGVPRMTGRLAQARARHELDLKLEEVEFYRCDDSACLGANHYHRK